MTNDLIPSRLWHIPSLLSDDEWPTFFQNPSGLSVSEDENKVYIEAQVPGVDPKDIEVTFEDGTLWIRAETKMDDSNKNRKFYRRSSSSFSYRISVPSDIDHATEPEAVCKNGVMAVTFTKSPQTQPKKIAVKTA